MRRVLPREVVLEHVDGAWAATMRATYASRGSLLGLPTCLLEKLNASDSLDRDSGPYGSENAFLSNIEILALEYICFDQKCAFGQKCVFKKNDFAICSPFF